MSEFGPPAQVIRQCDVITSVEELDSLGRSSVVIDSEEHVWVRRPSHWVCLCYTGGVPDADLENWSSEEVWEDSAQIVKEMYVLSRREGGVIR